MRFAAFLRSPKTRGLQMGPHVLEKLKKGFAVYLQSGTLMNAIKMRSACIACSAYPRQREYPQPPPPSKNSTKRTINTVSILVPHL
jgi:hypothetical protein